MNPEAQHLLMDLWLGQDVEPTVDRICELVDSRFKVVEKAQHLFTPQGRTIVFILSESHFTVHTYPELNYITLDIYICSKDFDLLSVRDAILDLTKPVNQNVQYMTRGYLADGKNNN